VPEIVGAIAGQPTPMTLFRSRDALARSSAPEHPGAHITYLYGADTPRVLTTPSHFAYVKIAEGCDYTCAFCIIPTLRGKYRSREADAVVREAEQLASQGVKELLLISQDTTFFGIDKGRRGALADLLRRLNDVSGLEWIRLLYLYPTTITNDVLLAMAECPKVCKYIDLPLQHASADVLRRMRRPGNRETYDKLLARIRRTVPDVTLRTTFIVGFPGETETDFAELMDFVRDTQFDHVGVFTYSHEEGTRAHGLDDDVPAKLKKARRDAVMRLQKQIVTARLKTRRGDHVRVMVDGVSPDSDLVMTGRLEGQAPEIDAQVYFDQCDPATLIPGTLVHATISGVRGYDLVVTPK
jgi:ribosomal protein S12 methylthiotransferase